MDKSSFIKMKLVFIHWLVSLRLTRNATKLSGVKSTLDIGLQMQLTTGGVKIVSNREKPRTSSCIGHQKCRDTYMDEAEYLQR